MVESKRIKSLPNDKMLNFSKCKVFADINFYETKMANLSASVENIAQKRENAGHQHFLLFGQFLQCRSKSRFFQGRSKSRVRIHQPFSRTFFVFVSKICKFECNTTSDWLNRTV